MSSNKWGGRAVPCYGPQPWWSPCVSGGRKNPLSDPTPRPESPPKGPRRPLRAARPEHGRRVECPQMGWPHRPMLWTPAVVVPRPLRRPGAHQVTPKETEQVRKRAHLGPSPSDPRLLKVIECRPLTSPDRPQRLKTCTRTPSMTQDQQEHPNSTEETEQVRKCAHLEPSSQTLGRASRAQINGAVLCVRQQLRTSPRRPRAPAMRFGG